MLNYFLIIVFCVCAIIDKRIKMIVCKALALFVCYLRTIRVEILSAAISWYSTTIFRLRSSQVVQGYLRYTIASATAIRYRFGLRSSHCHAYDTVFFYFMQLRYSSPWTFLAYHCTYDISCDLHTIFSSTIGCMSCSMTNFGAQLA